MKIIDSFMYNNEVALLLGRISFLRDFVDFFCIVESLHTFTGMRKEISAREIIVKEFGLEFFEARVVLFVNDEFIEEDNFERIKIKYENQNANLVRELNCQAEIIQTDRFVWLNDCFQRELLSLCITTCKNRFSIEDNNCVAIVSDVDEIPSRSFVSSALLEKKSIIYAEMRQYRYCLNVIDEDAWIGSVKFNWKALEKYSVNELRFALKRKSASLPNSQTLANSGWHFTSFGTSSEIMSKMNSWGHQELNTLINRTFMKFRLKYGLDIFGRNIAFKISQEVDLPIELAERLMEFRKFDIVSPGLLQRFAHRALWYFDRALYKGCLMVGRK